MTLTDKINEFKKNFYYKVKISKNIPNILLYQRGIKKKLKEEKLEINKTDKKELESCLKDVGSNLYDSIKKLGLKGRAQTKFFDLISELFVKRMEYDTDFALLEEGLDSKGTLEKIRSQKNQINEFIDKAGCSKEPFKYAKIFTRADSVEKALLLPKVIKGRKDIKLVKGYGYNEKEGEIEKVLRNTLEGVKGSAKEFIRLSEIVINPDFKICYEKNPEFYLRRNLIFDPDKKTIEFKSLENKGFLVLRDKDQFEIARIKAIYQVNNALPIYLTNNFRKDWGGFYHGLLKQIFVFENKQKESEKDSIQHELEHFIEWNLNMDIKNNTTSECGAFLGELMFSDNSQALWNGWTTPRDRYLMQFIQDSNRYKAHDLAKEDIQREVIIKAKEMGINDAPQQIAQRKFNIIKNSNIISALYNNFYKEHLGITYARLSGLCQ